MFSIRTSGEKFKQFFIQNLLYYIVKIFGIRVYKADFINDVDAELSDVAHLLLVFIIQTLFCSLNWKEYILLLIR